MQKTLLLALAASLVLAPAALAQEEPACPEGYNMTPEGCSRQAWVDDCPPDHMCAAGAQDGNETMQYGPDGCIECSGPAPDQGACMDGADADEDCRDDVQYLGPEPSRGPTDGLCENCRGETAQPEAATADRDAPAAGLALALTALGAAFLARRRLA